MTIIDSQTKSDSLSASDLVFDATKDDDDAQVGVLQITSEELEGLFDDSEKFDYYNKGGGKRPVHGGIEPGQASKHNKSSSSTPKVAANSAYGRTGPIKSTNTTHTSSKDQGKVRGAR